MTSEQNFKLIEKIAGCFQELAKESLYHPPAISNLSQWLHEDAPYSILAHNTEADPHFIYANKQAIACFKYTPEEIFSIPSRLSVIAQDRPEREQLLMVVTRDGIAYKHMGYRVDKYGSNFVIYDCIVWQLQHVNKKIWGQAALFWTEEVERPDWHTVKKKINH